MDVIVGAEIDHVLLLVTVGHIPGQRASRCRHGSLGGNRGVGDQVVVGPLTGIDQLVDAVAGAEVDHVLLAVPRGHVPNEGGSRRNRDGSGDGRGGQAGHVVVVPVVDIDQLMDALVATDEEHVLLVVERGLVATEPTAVAGGDLSHGPFPPGRMGKETAGARRVAHSSWLNARAFYPRGPSRERPRDRPRRSPMTAYDGPCPCPRNEAPDDDRWLRSRPLAPARTRSASWRTRSRS